MKKQEAVSEIYVKNSRDSHYNSLNHLKGNKMKTIPRALILLTFSILPCIAMAQGANVTGLAISNQTKQPLPGANILLTSLSDSTKKHIAVSNEKGEFTFINIPMQTYKLEASFIGYETISRKINVNSASYSIGTVRLIEKSQQIGTTTVTGFAVRASVRGDTTTYNADAYKVAKDADAESLISKMPGITSNNGTITAQGETVQKVLVDGKPFFGDDPTVALRSLPAEVIEKIQVFDKLSDQSEFTGFDDGNSVKTINIMTRQNKRTGQFGKFYAGYGTDNKYNIGGNVNIFKGDSRTSIIGMSNNVNQQNFSTDDILGVLGSSGGRGGMRGGGGFGGGRPGGPGSGSSVANFSVPQQSGITNTSAFGINFSDKIGQKVNLTGSYFFNYGKNTNLQTTNRQYFGSVDTAQHYTQNNEYTTTTYNNRVNMRIEYDIDQKNSLIVTPSFSYQSTRSNANSNAQTTLGPTNILNKTDNISNSLNEGYTFTNDILYRHKFDKNGRTFSFDFGNSFSDKSANSTLNAKNIYNTKKGETQDTISQRSNLQGKSYGFSGTAIYTEPLGAKAQLMVNYNVGYTSNDNDKRTYSLDNAGHQQMLLDTLLSNVYQSNYITQRLGLGIRLKGNKYNGMVNLMGQNAALTSDETFPVIDNINRNYTNLLPMAMMNLKFNQSNSLRLMYNMRTSAPSISQLQNVVDNSDPLNLYAGNPNLNQSTTNNINLRYSYTSMDKGKTLFVFMSGQTTQDYIGNATTLASTEMTLPNGTQLKKGATYTQPVNLNGYWSLNGMVNYGFPAAWLKSNVNISIGSGYSRMPGILNNKKIETKTFSPNGGIVIGSNFSTTLDFTLSYNASYNFIDNGTSNASSSNYWNQSARFKMNWTIANRFTVLPDINYTRYSGTGIAENNLLANLSVGVKLFHSRSGELRVGIYDILNQNKSFSRTVNSLYVEDAYNSVLKQYIMATFFYNLRNFKI